MTRTSCLATLSCAAALLAVASYGCGGSSDTINGGTGGGSGTGGYTGSGGTTGGSTGGTFGGTGGTFGGTGGTVAGTGGRMGGFDGGARDGRMGFDGGARDGRMGFDGGARDVVVREGGGRDAITRDIVVREIPQRDGGAGSIPMCMPMATCTSGTPAPTCNDPCMVTGGAMGERACTCVRNVVVCGQCRAARDGGGQ